MPKKRTEIPDLEQRVKGGHKKFVRYDEGAELYSVCIKTFSAMAKEAGAVYRVKRCCLVNTEIIDEYLENFHEK